MADYPPEPGDRVQLNARGIELFGGADATGILLGITDDGKTGQVQWESGQSTNITLTTIERIKDAWKAEPPYEHP